MWLSLGWRDARALVPVDAVWEVITGEAPLPVPGARGDLEGVIIRREMAVPVFDPRRWKGFFDNPPERLGGYVVVLNVEDCMDGIRAQEVDVIRSLEEGEPGGAPSPGLGTAFCPRTVLAAGGSAFGMLSLDSLARAMHHLPAGGEQGAQG